MRPKVKYAVIHRHRSEYPISVMCKFFEVSRSGYYDIPSNSKSGTGHDPLGHEEREKESRCGVTAPQRPGLSIHLTSILQANTILWHNTVAPSSSVPRRSLFPEDEPPRSEPIISERPDASPLSRLCLKLCFHYSSNGAARQYHGNGSG